MILVLMDTMIKALGATWRVTAPEQAGGEEQAEGGGSPVDGDGGAKVYFVGLIDHITRIFSLAQSVRVNYSLHAKL